MAGTLESVNVGAAQVVSTGRRLVRTSIWKAPVDGRVAVRGVNLEGDDQADRRVHGGPDKAVYAYAGEETDQWASDLRRELGPGSFGENLTTRGVDVSGARLGERWRVGTTLLEVVQPRIPCFKLGVRFGDPRMVKAFALARRPGAYLRILEEGELGAGDVVEVLPAPADRATELTVRFVFEALVLDEAKRAEVLAYDHLLDELRWMLSRTVEHDTT